MFSGGRRGQAEAQPQPQRFKLSESCTLTIVKGDLTRWEGDAIVNAANERMLGGGGVDGAIHRAAGRGLLEACRAVPVDRGVRCPTGEARITEGFELPAAFVIHTVGPVYDNDEESRPLLQAAYRNSLALANSPEHDIHSIAFPAISCGVYGYPWDKAAEIALEACRDHHGRLREVYFVLFSNDIMQAFLQAAAALLPPLEADRDAESSEDSSENSEHSASGERSSASTGGGACVDAGELPDTSAEPPITSAELPTTSAEAPNTSAELPNRGAE